MALSNTEVILSCFGEYDTCAKLSVRSMLKSAVRRGLTGNLIPLQTIQSTIYLTNRYDSDFIRAETEFVQLEQSLVGCQ